MAKHSRWATDAEIITDTYRGPDRRHQGDSQPDDTISKEIRFDDKGNPVLDVRSTASRRRQEDDTIDLLKSLNPDALELEDGD